MARLGPSSLSYVDPDELRINLLGWSSQPVLFDEYGAHHLGSSRVGSETSERKALSLSGLWRLSHNTDVPTVFCTDSVTAERQGAGHHDAGEADLSYRFLRGVFQGLREALGSQALAFSHVTGHSGDPWNDLADLAARKERHQSSWLPRQRVDLRRWQDVIPHLWMVFATDGSVPGFCGDHFDICAPALPPSQGSPSNASTCHEGQLQLSLSFCSANV